MAKSRRDGSTANSNRGFRKPVKVQRLPNAVSDTLLEKLKPFLETLSPGELQEIPRAAAKRRTSKFQPRPAQSVELIFARVNGRTVGALLLSRQWIESCLQRPGNQTHSGTASPINAALSDWLMEYGHYLGQLVQSEIKAAPAKAWMHTPEDCLAILEHYWSQDRDVFNVLWPLPKTQGLLEVVRNANPQERRRLKRLEQQRLTDGRGAPTKAPEDTKCVLVAEAVNDAESRLAPAFKIKKESQQRRSPNQYQKGTPLFDTLHQNGFNGAEISAVIDGRSLAGAAQILVGKERGLSPASVRAMASAGRKLLNSAY